MKTIIQLFEETVQQFPENPFLWEKKTTQFESTSYTQVQQLVHQYSAGLLAMGISKGDRVALLSEGRNDWVLAELAILHTGAINVPLSIKLEPSELKFRLDHSEAKMIIVSKNQAVKFTEIRENLPKLEHVVFLENTDLKLKKDVLWNDICKNGDCYLKENPDAVTKAMETINGDDYANISYTSGTTADPKGIILSHRNYTANVEQTNTLMDIPSHYKTLLILPLDHCFAHVAGIYSFMAFGASIATVQTGNTPMQTLKNIPINIKEIKPDLLLSVPALAKNFKKNIEAGIAAKGKFTEKLFNLGLNVSIKYNKEGYNKGWGTSALLRPLVKFFDKILFSKVREVFGGDLKFFIGGGALLDIELQRFYYAIGIPMLQGYGLSEATPVISSNSLHKHKLGSSGYLVQPLDLKICDDAGNELPLGEKGEIVIRGENVMKGYWKNEAATAETVKDGWLHTGDLGYMDSDGFLYVLGRFKSLLIGNDGEKYSPESIEETVVSKSKVIDQLMLHNNQDPYTIGLIVPNKQALSRLIAERGFDTSSKEGKEEMLKMIQEEINHYRKGGKYFGEFPERWLPAAFAVLDEPFSEANKFINSTLKMVRGKITDHYRERIDYLYSPEAKNIMNDLNLDAMHKIHQN
jgi:long-chain acyl-CoA synthetase